MRPSRTAVIVAQPWLASEGASEGQGNMLPVFQCARPHLSIRRPSPTTAEFIVSSHPPPTIVFRILLGILLAARVLLALALLLLLYANVFPIVGSEQELHRHHNHHNYHHYYYNHHHHHHHSFGPVTAAQQLHSALRALALSTSPTRHLARLAPTLSTWVVAGCAGAAVWIATLQTHTTETLLVLRGLGVQVQSRFIPTSKILDVLINEAFVGFEVRYYLGVIVEGEDDVVVVFSTVLPGREVVEAVWRGVRGCLWEGDLVRRAGGDDRG